MGRARPSLLFIASGFAVFFLSVLLLETDLLLVPHKSDPRVDAWMIPFPIVQTDGTVQIVNPPFINSYDSLMAVVRDGGNVEIVKDTGTKAYGNLTVVLDPELAVNYDKFSFINLTSYNFHWLNWQTWGNLRIYNAGGGKKKIEMYLVSINHFHKKYFGEYEFFDRKITLSTYNCERFLFLRFLAFYLISLFLIFLGFVLMIGDIISSRRAKKRKLSHAAR